MEPIICTITTDDGGRFPLAAGVVEVLVGDQCKKIVTRECAVDQSLLCERILLGGKWQLVVAVDCPKCE